MPSGESPSSRSSNGLSRIHREHNSATSTIAAFTTVHRGPRIDPRLLQSCNRVLSHGRPFERFGARALPARKRRPSSSGWAIGLRLELAVQTKRTFFTRSRLRGITSTGAIRTASVRFSVDYTLTDYTGNFLVLSSRLLSGIATRQSCRSEPRRGSRPGIWTPDGCGYNLLDS